MKSKKYGIRAEKATVKSSNHNKHFQQYLKNLEKIYFLTMDFLLVRLWFTILPQPPWC